MCHTCGIVVNYYVRHLCGMSRDDLHFRLRIPEDLKSQVEAAARENHRSMTAEIVARLTASFSTPQPDETVIDFARNYARELLQFMARDFPDAPAAKLAEVAKRLSDDPKD